MGEVNQLIRGYKWFLTKKADGTYDKGVEDSIERTNDLNAYLSFVENKDKEKVNKILLNIRLQQRANKQRPKIISELKEMLKSESLVKKVEPVKSKDKKELKSENKEE